MKKALIIVDVQNDFCPGGALAVPNGDQVVVVANDLVASGKFDLVVYTKDWHPKDHGSFASVQGKPPSTLGELNGLPQVLWPDHCVQGTNGAELHPKLLVDAGKVFVKGTDPKVDSYSGFYDNGNKKTTGKSTGLSGYLTEKEVNEVYVMGLATDYCVKATAIDAATDGFATFLVIDGCRAVNVKPGDAEKSLMEMANAGVIGIHSWDI